MKLRNKVMAGLLCGVMATTAIPVTAFAADTAATTAATTKSYKTYSKTITANGKYYSISNSKVQKGNVSFSVNKKGIVTLKCSKDGKFSVKGVKAGAVTVTVRNKKTKAILGKYKITVNPNTVSMFTDMGEYFEDFSGEFVLGFDIPEAAAELTMKGAVDGDKSYFDYTVKDADVSISMKAFHDDDVAYISSEALTLSLIAMEIQPTGICENKMVKITEDDGEKFTKLIMGEDYNEADLAAAASKLEDMDIDEKTIKSFVTKLESRLSAAGVLKSTKNSMSLVVDDGGKKLIKGITNYVNKDLGGLLKKLDFDGADELFASFKESKAELVQSLKELDPQLPKMELKFTKKNKSAVLSFIMEELDLDFTMNFNHKSDLKNFDINDYAPKQADVISFDEFIEIVLENQ